MYDANQKVWKPRKRASEMHHYLRARQLGLAVCPPNSLSLSPRMQKLLQQRLLCLEEVDAITALCKALSKGLAWRVFDSEFQNQFIIRIPNMIPLIPTRDKMVIDKDSYKNLVRATRGTPFLSKAILTELGLILLTMGVTTIPKITEHYQFLQIDDRLHLGTLLSSEYVLRLFTHPQASAIILENRSPNKPLFPEIKERYQPNPKFPAYLEFKYDFSRSKEELYWPHDFQRIIFPLYLNGVRDNP